VANPIDAFIRARLLEVGVLHAPQSDRPTLIRRLSLDLLGLPPSPEEVRLFVADTRHDAWERLVDRYLANVHFGERQAQHWLDVARYAESNGYEGDGERPQAWRYRDWVVRSFNQDLPYDRFVTDQIAGDLLVRKNPADKEPLLAVGFHRCGPIHQVAGNVDPEEIRYEFLTEITTGVGTTFLGLSLHCARCHDHKFDPVSQEDYFRLEAFFSRAKPKEIDLATTSERLQHTKEAAVIQAQVAPIRAQLAAIEAPYRDRIRKAKHAALEKKYKDALAIDASKRTMEQRQLVSDAQPLLKVTWDEVVDALSVEDRIVRSRLRAHLHALEAKLPPPPARAWSLHEDKGKLETHLLKRGMLSRKGKRLTPGFPDALVRGTTPDAPDRLQLAAWLTSGKHPLTARVMVNRLWQHHFGQGLVSTPNDFGLRGERPSHPELLDWLAIELVESGWSLKRLHRLMLLSETYRQSSTFRQEKAQSVDQDNRLLWRMNRRRMDAETLRDSVLAASGQLNRNLGGAMIRIPLEQEVYDLIFTEDEPDNLWPVTLDTREHTRRTIYLFNKRNVRLPLLESFDLPDTQTSCPVRGTSTFAPQALVMLNGPFVQEQARRMAVTLWEDGKDGRIDRAYQRALGRSPTAPEVSQAKEFLQTQTRLLEESLRLRRPIALPAVLPSDAPPAEIGALSDFCLALLNRNAFIYVE
jgi:hypothetical protein